MGEGIWPEHHMVECCFRHQHQASNVASGFRVRVSRGYQVDLGYVKFRGTNDPRQ